jgi:hypothetical protein
MWGSPGTVLAHCSCTNVPVVPLSRAVSPHGAHIVVATALVEQTHATTGRRTFGYRYVHRRGARLRRHGIAVDPRPSPARRWAEWQRCIDSTVQRCATIEDGLVNQRPRPPNRRPRRTADTVLPRRAEVRHSLGGFPSNSLDDLLLGGGEATWRGSARESSSIIRHWHCMRSSILRAHRQRCGSGVYAILVGRRRPKPRRSCIDLLVQTNDPVHRWSGIHQVRAFGTLVVAFTPDYRCAVARLPTLWCVADASSATLICAQNHRFDVARDGYVNHFPRIIVAHATPATKIGWWPRDDAFSTRDTIHRCMPGSPQR